MKNTISLHRVKKKHTYVKGEGNLPLPFTLMCIWYITIRDIPSLTLTICRNLTHHLYGNYVSKNGLMEKEEQRLVLLSNMNRKKAALNNGSCR